MKEGSVAISTGHGRAAETSFKLGMKGGINDVRSGD